MNSSILRFPRTADKDLLYMVRVKCKYPPPPFYDEKLANPADWVFSRLMDAKEEQLREWCEKHALKSSGPRRKLIKRMYLHWRAKTLLLKNRYSEYFGYGKGYRNTRTPECSCGFLRQDYLKHRAVKVLDSKNVARFPRIPRIQRFPRLLRK